MNTDTKTKICKDCRVAKALTDYYKHRAMTYRPICKPCDIINRRKYIIKSNYVHKGKRKSGFDILPKQQQIDISNDIAIMTMKEVSLKYNINKNTLNTWKRRGYLTADGSIN